MIPLRYSISEWRQLPKCKSNTSSKLSLHVTDYSTTELSGLGITVEHKDFGVLFAFVVDAVGTIIQPNTEDAILSNDQILKELARYGFFVEFEESDHLSGDQINYLMTLSSLGFDKIRILGVKFLSGPQGDIIKRRFVAFQTAQCYNWLNNTYVATKQEFEKKLTSGAAIDLTEVSSTKSFNWNWLDYVANISDIVMSNK